MSDGEEARRRKYEKEALDRKAKAGIQADANTTPLKMVKNYIVRKPLIHPVTCKKCGKTFKTNKDTEYCFKCSKTIKMLEKK